MCRNECVKDYLPSVDVQATEGLILCMYAPKAYVSLHGHVPKYLVTHAG